MILLVFIASCLVAWVLVGLARTAALRFGVMDVPNVRSSHVRPIPRGGGIAIVIVVLAAVVVAFRANALSTGSLIAWTSGGGIVAFAGLLDDVRDLSAAFRLGLHFAAAAILLLSVWRAPGGWSPVGPTAVLICIASAVAIVWSINLYNFMDGINGLAAAQCVFVAGAAGYFMNMEGESCLSLLPLIALSGAALGFFVWNFPVARIFMGDVGSGFIGFAVAAGAFLNYRQGTLSVWTWVTLNGLFAADASTTLLVRLINGERIYEAHRNHAYQHMAVRLGSHRSATIIYSAINVIWCLPFAAATVHFRNASFLWAIASILPLVFLAFAVGAGKTAR